MTARQLFEKLGYEQTRNDDDYILYEKKVSHDIKIVNFCSQTESIRVSFESECDTPSVNMQLLSAIQAQVDELDWKD